MATLPDDSEMSLEEDRFEVECWRYVGEPIGFGSTVSGQLLTTEVTDLARGSGPAQTEKSDGWFGVSLSTSSFAFFYVRSVYA